MPNNLSIIGSVWRHKTRGTTYEVIADHASMQCATDPDLEERFEAECWIVYRSERTGAVTFRLAEEFLDGRFERVNNEG